MANEKFKINGVVSEVVPIVGDAGDVLKKTVAGVEWGSLDKATQAEAEAGTNDTKIMTPLRVKQVTEQYATKTEWNNKVDKVSGKQLSTNDYTTTEKNKLAGIQAGAEKNNVTSVAGKTGAVTITKSDLGLGSVENIGIVVLSEAEYNALSDTEKQRKDKLYGVYDG